MNEIKTIVSELCLESGWEEATLVHEIPPEQCLTTPH